MPPNLQPFIFMDSLVLLLTRYAFKVKFVTISSLASIIYLLKPKTPDYDLWVASVVSLFKRVFKLKQKGCTWQTSSSCTTSITNTRTPKIPAHNSAMDSKLNDAWT